MRRWSKGTLCLATFAFLAASLSTAAAQIPVGPGGFAKNFEWVRSVPLLGSTIPVSTFGLHGPHAEIHGEFLFVSPWEGVSIYDVSDPREPRFINHIPRPGPSWIPLQERFGSMMNYSRFATNGEILLINGYDPGEVDFRLQTMYVYDVSDKTNVQLLSTLNWGAGRGGSEDEWGTGSWCLFDCTWAYDRTGAIIDLRDPLRPRWAGTWTKGLTFNGASFTDGPAPAGMSEVAPGMMLVGSHPMVLLDARRDPSRPRVIVRTDGSPYSRGDLAWPNFPEGDVVLSTNFGGRSGERARCEFQEENKGTVDGSALATWDASSWRRSGFLTRTDEYRLKNGSYTDGDPAFSGTEPPALGYDNGCRLSNLDVHPSSNKTLVAVAAQGHGVKVLTIGGAGQIRQGDWFLPHGGDVRNVLWRNDRILYTIDAHRGIDVLRYTGKI